MDELLRADAPHHFALQRHEMMSALYTPRATHFLEGNHKQGVILSSIHHAKSINIVIAREDRCKSSEKCKERETRKRFLSPKLASFRCKPKMQPPGNW